MERAEEAPRAARVEFRDLTASSVRSVTNKDLTFVGFMPFVVNQASAKETDQSGFTGVMKAEGWACLSKYFLRIVAAIGAA